MTSASDELRHWLDTVCIDTTSWRKEEVVVSSHPYYTNADKKERDKEYYRHKFMIENYDWYRDSIDYYRHIMELDESELGLEPDPIEYGQEGFWEQFNGKS